MSGPARTTSHASSKAAVLDVIRAAGTISRVGLINATGLTGATISTVVRGLIEDGLVVETGRAESTGGKRRVLLELDHSARYAIGVHLDHAGITYVLTNLGGAVVGRISRPGAGAAKPADVVERMAAEAAALVGSVGIDRERVLGLGLVSPGPLSASAGMALPPPTMRQWSDFPLDTVLGQATGLPVLLDNDATAAALGEHWSGGVDNAATVAALYMGTGIGAGLLVNGITYRGASGNAGEVGHICLDPFGPECWCGARGCLEALAGPSAVVAAARADKALARAAGLGRRRSVSADFAAVSRAARKGEPAALELLERSARYLAVATRTLANVMDLEAVVLTGPSFAIAGAIYLPIVQEELDRAFFSRANHPVRVRLSASAATASAIGAAAMVLQSELVPLHHGLRLPGNLVESEPPPVGA
ncbi:ROK family transcriptional regulator [Actinokineospora sp. UTMC 2448]|uniref:ROK family transcriptional regulator n=1 Tax=Actinokineospora sp. UTMC 2448 TaxID=2268449 RepID=UPI0021643188|nr:ROK family transcriptional regulator [Actinokineospora sp. UTMC 2448]UVS78135.1 N-acetylglucosamine repressor [Actinokineospora sp. UTMC 2448]